MDLCCVVLENNCEIWRRVTRIDLLESLLEQQVLVVLVHEIWVCETEVKWGPVVGLTNSSVKFVT